MAMMSKASRAAASKQYNAGYKEKYRTLIVLYFEASNTQLQSRIKRNYLLSRNVNERTLDRPLQKDCFAAELVGDIAPLHVSR